MEQFARPRPDRHVRQRAVIGHDGLGADRWARADPDLLPVRPRHWRGPAAGVIRYLDATAFFLASGACGPV
jgi:hypothetical protein